MGKSTNKHTVSMENENQLPLEENVSTSMIPTNEFDIQKNQPKNTMMVSNNGIVLSTFDELWRFSCAIVKSKLCKKDDTAEAVMIKIQMGLEIGLPAMSAVQNIAVINGTPSVYGDVAKALVLASPCCEYITETNEGEGDSLTYICTSKRRGENYLPFTTKFSVADAKKAKLWTKTGPWSDYPARMLMFRARGFNLRDNFPDVLKGIKTYEEVADYDVLDSKIIQRETIGAKPGTQTTL